VAPVTGDDDGDILYIPVQNTTAGHQDLAIRQSQVYCDTFCGYGISVNGSAAREMPATPKTTVNIAAKALVFKEHMKLSPSDSTYEVKETSGQITGQKKQPHTPRLHLLLISSFVWFSVCRNN